MNSCCGAILLLVGLNKNGIIPFRFWDSLCPQQSHALTILDSRRNRRGKGQSSPFDFGIYYSQTFSLASKGLCLPRIFRPSYGPVLQQCSAVHAATAICNKRQAIPIKKKTGPDRQTLKWRRNGIYPGRPKHQRIQKARITKMVLCY